MRNSLATILIILGIATPVLAEEQPASAPRPGPLMIHSASDPARPAGERLSDWPGAAAIDRLAVRGGRPSALPPLYVTLAVLNALDIYSTNRALSAGGRELNPVMAATNGHLGAALAIKGATTASSIFLSEKLRKNHRLAAVITMVVVDGATAAVVARNFRNAR